ncbi:MAG TPA: hypothetical protein VHG91_08705 [Longimicrobium sp.]|nr:hypothetical protein [Longimicrobium sp.]
MTEQPTNPTRREFAKAAAAALAAPVLAPLAACAGGPEAQPAPTPAATTNAAAPTAPTAPSAPPNGQNRQAPDPMAEGLTEALRARYGDRLTEAQWKEVREGVEGNLRLAKQLRDFPLPIATEPAFAFRAYREGP